MSDRRTPLDALRLAMAYSRVSSSLRPRGRPGEIIEAMNPDERRTLARLTSAELARVRVEPWEVTG